MAIIQILSMVSLLFGARGYDEVENMAVDDSGKNFQFLYYETVVDRITYRQKTKGFLMPVGSAVKYAVPYRPNPALAGDDIFNAEDTQR